MSSLRPHNAACLVRWLDSYADRFPGRMPPETVIKSRHLEASTPLKKGAYNRIEAYRKAREANATDWEERRGQTDDLLLDLTGRYLRERAESAPKGERARYHLMHRAARQVLLNEYVAGGHCYLLKLEEMGRAGNTAAGAVAEFARAAVNELLDELDRREFRLEVEEDPSEALGEDPYKRGWAKRKVAMDYEGTWRRLARERQELIDAGMSKVKATKRVAEKNGCSQSKVEKSVKWMRDNEKNLGDIPRMKTA